MLNNESLLVKDIMFISSVEKKNSLSKSWKYTEYHYQYIYPPPPTLVQTCLHHTVNTRGGLFTRSFIIYARCHWNLNFDFETYVGRDVK